MKYFNWCILFALLFFTSVLNAQDEDEKDDNTIAAAYNDNPPSEPPKSIHIVSIRLAGGVPNPITSQLFRKKFIGIYEANLSVNIRIGNYAYIGAGYKNALFSVSNRTKFENHTKMQMNTAYLRAGYDKYHSGKVFSSVYMNLGYAMSVYTSVPDMDNNPHDLHVAAAFLQPTYSINFFAEERMTLGFYAGYNYMLWQFNPDQINLAATEPNIKDFKNKSNASYWIIGLEMYIGLGKQK